MRKGLEIGEIFVDFGLIGVLEGFENVEVL